jgi:signal transduction histidine kinase
MKQQREKLGDRKSEITILIDNDKITRLYPNINNQLRYQRKRQQNTTGIQPQGSQAGTLPPSIDSFSYNNNPNPNYQ